MTVLDQDEEVGQEEAPEEIDEEEIEHDRQVRHLEERLRRLRIVGTAEVLVAGGFEEEEGGPHGFAIEFRKEGGGEGGCCSGTDCFSLTEEECGDAGGEYQGEGTTCDPNPCAPVTGACCFENGSCEVLTVTRCGDFGGDYQGDATDCEPNPCPQPPPPTGACCVGEACSIETESDCTDMGGTYLGDDATCIPNPCAVGAQGACCIDFFCSLRSHDACLTLGGDYLGDATTCFGSPCATALTGACCCVEAGGTAYNCTVGTLGGCIALGTGGMVCTYLGDGINCISGDEPNCLPAGACCSQVDPFGCTFMLLTDCADSGGRYCGNLVDCSNITCPNCDPI